jgi:hypothetical protein
MDRKGSHDEPTASPNPQRRWRVVALGLGLAAAGLVMALHPQSPSRRPAPPPSQRPCLPGGVCPDTSTTTSGSTATRTTATLRQEALRHFNQGDPEGAVAALARLGQTQPSEAAALQEALRSNWNRNRLEAAQAERLAAMGHWWEALDALNRLDHPWWQRHSQALRRRVEQGAAALEQEHDQHSHGPDPAGVPTERLDAEIRKRLRLGLPQWQAFKEGCNAVGGEVLEEGPEVNCKPRRGQQRP